MQSQQIFEAVMIKFISTFDKYKNYVITPQTLSDGHIFADLLRTAYNFQLGVDTLIQNPKVWTYKLTNLRRICERIQIFFQQNDKGIKMYDIDLIQIARSNCRQNIIKLFEVVIAVLMQSSNKNDYIETILSLDQVSQSTFMTIIKNGLETRQTTLQYIKQKKLLFSIQQLEIQNQFLREQFVQLFENKEKLELLNKQFETQMNQYENELTLTKSNSLIESINYEQIPKEIYQLKAIVHNLKQRLFQTAVQHQQETARLKEQITTFQTKFLQMQQLEQALNLYKEKYEEQSYQLSRFDNWQKQKVKILKVCEEKQCLVKKLQDKIQQIVQTNYAMQQNQVYMKIQLEKKDVRFKQLEKQVRNKLVGNYHSEIQLPLSHKENLSFLNTKHDDNEQIKEQLDKARYKAKQLEKQNRILFKKAEKSSYWQNQKKRYEKMLLELNQSRNQEIQILILSLYELSQQNIKMNDVIIANKSMISVLNQ